MQCYAWLRISRWKCRLCISHALRLWHCGRSKSHVRIQSRNRNRPLSSARIARGWEGGSSASGKGSRAACGLDAPAASFSNTSQYTYPLIPSPRSFLKEERARAATARSPMPGVHSCTSVFQYKQLARANFPRARARVISGRRDGDASVCDRDPAASRRLRHFVSLSSFFPLLLSPPLLCCRDLLVSSPFFPSEFYV